MRKDQWFLVDSRLEFHKMVKRLKESIYNYEYLKFLLLISGGRRI